ncbi:MAG: DNA-directed RNA polymerase subunit omega [Eubacteriaceae bacterium]|jgi:DNA-directed RNA polymerase subunit omega|nr:DNA-directed RNA polymerase subunit omega [Eubacteriaceae bacterium]MDD4507615.1 DNA-directed RNA polymerase subunit omega [Eubacteriaceae bacterium]
MNKTYQGKEAKGMRYPAINDLISKAENKYELVLATAKRARELVDGVDPLVKVTVDNPVSIATKEIAEGEVRIVSHKEDKKTDEVASEKSFKETESVGAQTIAEMAEEDE